MFKIGDRVICHTKPELGHWQCDTGKIYIISHFKRGLRSELYLGLENLKGYFNSELFKKSFIERNLPKWF